ncbi:hypothetical protein TRIATDRAFT_284456, partial [Trichoderma atroviride IMI 206040]
ASPLYNPKSSKPFLSFLFQARQENNFFLLFTISSRSLLTLFFYSIFYLLLLSRDCHSFSFLCPFDFRTPQLTSSCRAPQIFIQ